MLCVWSLFYHALISVPSSFASILSRKRARAGCFYFNCLSDFCDSQCSVALPHGTKDWSAVCDCGIYGSYSLVLNVC